MDSDYWNLSYSNPIFHLSQNFLAYFLAYFIRNLLSIRRHSFALAIQFCYSLPLHRHDRLAVTCCGPAQTSDLVCEHWSLGACHKKRSESRAFLNAFTEVQKASRFSRRFGWQNGVQAGDWNNWKKESNCCSDRTMTHCALEANAKYLKDQKLPKSLVLDLIVAAI